MSNLCSEAELAELVRQIEQDDLHDLQSIDALVQRYPEDPRLHFMRGSVLAGKQRAIEAHASLSKAVTLAPDFSLARYQLGFFELTSGEADKALSTWGPLLKLPRDNYLRVFAEGLTYLIRDEFDDAIARLREGIALNEDNVPMNRDIELLIAECERLRANTGGAGDDGDDGAQSATSFILGQFTSDTKH